VIVIDARQCSVDMPLQEMIAEFDHVGAPVILLVDARRSLGPWERRAITLPLPSAAQRRAWWATLAPDADQSLASTATHLDPQDIRDAANGTESAALARVTGQTRRSRVQTVKPAIRLSDVILDERPERMLRSLCDRVRYRSTVLDEWGMRPGGARGRGVTALFAGPAGTGKTMSGEAIAGELGVPLFVVDLASVVDKYIGETEKNLEDVFRTVENEDGVLLFDEADALFGKRSDVSDARDRYANIEVAYLLQRIEAFDGLAILTTNLRANLDDAFQRRLDMIVDFPEPGPDARRTIWAAALGPFAGALSDEDCEALGTLDITGGYIRAAMVSAAYLAAADGQTLQRKHILEGVREEWRKAGRLNFPDHVFAHWTV
jgi:SpoVK/Ycf46/Vps4 family AAA+-type ATPase